MAVTKAHTGTVTFLFTDIVGSTEMWEKHGDAFLPVLQAHNAILADAVLRYGGHLFKEEGDAFKVAFSDPASAVKCAILAQAALQRYPWPEDVGPLRVRIAVHTGTPFVQGNDYFGPPVNRAARILSAVHGGQILVSENTAELVEGRLDSGSDLADQGRHQLKDLDNQIRLFQVTHPALNQTSFPPPRSLNGHAHNLPTQRRSFIGREKEIAHIASRFAGGDQRLLTLTGPEGSGKTRLAVQASAEYMHVFPDGVWLVSLSNAVDLVGAAIEIAGAMHIPLTPAKPPLETVRDYLAKRSCLLILDDLGNVPQADKLIRELLTGTESLRCLATSRQPLASFEGQIGGSGEQMAVPEFEIPSADSNPDKLMASEGGRLFAERAHENRQDFEVTSRNAPTIARLLQKIKPTPANIENLADMIQQASLSSLGQIVAKSADIGRQAVAHGKEALERVKSTPELAAFQQSLAAGIESEDPIAAERRWQEALATYTQLGDRRGAAESLRRLGNLAVRRKEFIRAYKLLSAAHQMFIDVKSPESLAVRLEVDSARKALGQAQVLGAVPVDEAIGIAMGKD